nr:hypothetical protein [uncultured Rhodopila sp.]
MRVFRPALVPLILLSACASVSTFVNSTSDLTSGRTEQSVQESRQREGAAINENVALRNQYASLQAQKTALRGQLAAAQNQLARVNKKLAQESGATREQRDEYNRLVEKQRDLQNRLARASAAPSPADPAAAADQKARLDQLEQEKDVLARQVDALQRAL